MVVPLKMLLNQILMMYANYYVALDILVRLELNDLKNILKNILGLVESTFSLITFISVYRHNGCDEVPVVFI